MAATLLSALVTCLGSLALGQAALRLFGARTWTWLAAPTGVSILMLLAIPAIHVPGRSVTVAVLIAALVLVSLLWCARAPEHRPPLSGLLAVLPVAALTLVPFLAAGRAGTLGTAINNDMATHMSIVEDYLSGSAARIIPLPADYPLGPHAVVAALSGGLGVRVDQAFAGFSIALPILLAWTALMAAPSASLPARVLTATVVGMPFLIAAYYGEASFKEVLQAQLVLAVALFLAGCRPAVGLARWVPLALLFAGSLSVYSALGLPWLVSFLGIWLLLQGARSAYRGGRRAIGADVRAALPTAALAVFVFLLVLVPQFPRLHRFVAARAVANTIGIPVSNLGNLVGPIPGWETLGVWSNPDFRFPATSPFAGGMWAALISGLVVLGMLWSLSRGRWMLPAAAATSLVIWIVSDQRQSPYVSAKALVILSPLLLSVAVVPLVDRAPRAPVWWKALGPIAALILLVGVVRSDWRALRSAEVGPTNHLIELRSLRPLLRGRPTLFLGNDDFVRWELTGVPVTAAVINLGEMVPIRPQKAWSYGVPLDFDSVDAATLNAYEWVITTRDTAASAPPPQYVLARTTASYQVWHRNGAVTPREVLNEGSMPGAILDCRKPQGRALAQRDGIAAVRTAPVSTPAPAVPPGGTVMVRLVLHPGRWSLETPYQSPRPLIFTAPGLHAGLPASLDVVGPRWHIGVVSVPSSGSLDVRVHATTAVLTPSSAAASVTAIVATPLGTEHDVPLRSACGAYVDWYQLR